MRISTLGRIGALMIGSVVAGSTSGCDELENPDGSVTVCDHLYNVTQLEGYEDEVEALGYSMDDYKCVYIWTDEGCYCIGDDDSNECEGRFVGPSAPDCPELTGIGTTSSDDTSSDTGGTVDTGTDDTSDTGWSDTGTDTSMPVDTDTVDTGGTGDTADTGEAEPEEFEGTCALDLTWEFTDNGSGSMVMQYTFGVIESDIYGYVDGSLTEYYVTEISMSDSEFDATGGTTWTVNTGDYIRVAAYHRATDGTVTDGCEGDGSSMVTNGTVTATCTPDDGSDVIEVSYDLYDKDYETDTGGCEWVFGPI